MTATPPIRSVMNYSDQPRPSPSPAGGQKRPGPRRALPRILLSSLPFPISDAASRHLSPSPPSPPPNRARPLESPIEFDDLVREIDLVNISNIERNPKFAFSNLFALFESRATRGADSGRGIP